MREIKLDGNQIWSGIIGGVLAGMILIITDTIGGIFPTLLGIVIKLLLAFVILLIMIVAYVSSRKKGNKK